ncbi:[NiFe]-hydrogenase assembly, chaperone, HybE [Rhodoferax lacus]|uniref:[NiFe]-hydrogenase assembly, chaperone, HybE n=1 Tax=Rhodoferax lacus TaxID=2184758 RepID=A0A3E1R6B4_9BURK|nr:[NiFe]-hydrogenase assembly chaperone HybE [Rhodoferax lacus]RFO94909.1 [NiFe]-hydrogenase assembly, chaperone, HybE [Rhodoferax lacus]
MDHASPASSALRALQQRTAALRALFDEVCVVRMHGVPILNPALRVATVGFEVMGLPATDTATDAPDAPLSAVGILITPWFMNLVCFRLARQDQPALVGSSSAHAVGSQRFDFIAAHEERFGNYAACSLFSPMFEFKNQATAVATAEAVLAELRKPPELASANASVPVPVPVPGQAAPARPAAPQAAAPAAPGLSSMPGRRGFLLGRRSATPGATP